MTSCTAGDLQVKKEFLPLHFNKYEEQQIGMDASFQQQSSCLAKYTFSSFCGDREISWLAPFLQSTAIEIQTNPVTSKHFVNSEHPANDQTQKVSFLLEISPARSQGQFFSKFCPSSFPQQNCCHLLLWHLAKEIPEPNPSWSSLKAVL